MEIVHPIIVSLALLLFVSAACDPQPGPPAAETPPPSRGAAVASTTDISPSVTAAAPPTVAAARPTPPSTEPRSTQPATTAAPLAVSPATPSPPTPTSAPTLTAIPTPVATLTPAPTATPAAAPLTRIEFDRVAGGFQRPTFVGHAGDASGRLFVLEKVGLMRIVVGNRVGGAPFLDITDRVGSGSNEQGLLGLAFHPRFASNGRFFLNYTDRGGDTVVSEFRVSPADADRADPASERVLIGFDQPFRNHNGGMLAFGPDGRLYIATGDGGSQGDPNGNAQNPATLLGAILRIDVDGGEPYAIPPDNPFVGNASARPEVWAYGLRNPWRISFDRATGDLYIADVGQNEIEEVHVQPAASPGGENYGWNVQEGSNCYRPDSGCDRRGLVQPVAEYTHSQGCSITGGYVYRGAAHPALVGHYVFADYCSGLVWTLRRGAGDTWSMAPQARVDLRISSFGEGEDGEIYAVDDASGGLYVLRALT